MKKTLLTLALSAAGIAAMTAAQAQPAPAPAPGAPVAPAPTATTAPSAPPAAPSPGAPADPAPTATTAPPAPPPAVPGAQPVDPNAPPAPPPAAPVPPPPPVAAPVTPVPAQPVFVPPPVAPVTWSTQPPPAAAAPAAKPGMSLLARFAGSSIGWNHSATTTLLGVGGSCASSLCNESTGGGTLIGHEGDSYTQILTFAPGFFLFRNDTHAVRASAAISMFTELTNSDSTTYERQPDVFDVPIRIADTIKLASWGSSGDSSNSTSAGALARDPTLAGAAEYRTQLILSGGALLPTSRASQGSGLNLTSSFIVGLRQQVKLFGSSSDYLGNITFTLSERWDHQFSDATTRVNPDLNRTRQTAAGGPLLSDQLAGGAMVENRLIHTLSFFLPVYGDLQLSGAYQLWNDLPFQFQGTECEVELATGCVNTPASESKLRAVSVVDVSLYYQFSPEFGADIGYSNFTGQLGEDGKTRNPFYSPNATFYADLILFPDQLIKRIITPSKPATQVGSR